MKSLTIKYKFDANGTTVTGTAICTGGKDEWTVLRGLFCVLKRITREVPAFRVADKIQITASRQKPAIRKPASPKEVK
jgi:hypothetical protein